jgi:myo-inositol-1(or 4)-monophosphatase
MTEELLRTAEEAARAAGEILRAAFRSGALEIEAKAKHDFVTSADRASEERILDLLRGRFPDHRIVTEESGSLGGTDDHQWFVDPLDGTTNFLQGLPIYGISIACRAKGRTIAGVVFDPERDDLFAARRGEGAWWNGEPIHVSSRTGLEDAFLATGYPFKAKKALDTYLEVFRAVFLRARAIRRCGAAALDLAYTAAGVFDGLFEFRLSPWDIAAGALLIEEAGGRVSDLDGGGRYLLTGNVIAGSQGVHQDLVVAVGRHATEAAVESLVPVLTTSPPHSC